MKTSYARLRGSWLLRSLAASLLWLSLPIFAQAAGTVTNCTSYGPGPGTLGSALMDGGTITFACSGTITGFPSGGAFITMPTVIDGSGYAVVLSGNNTTRLFFVSNTTLELIAVTLADAVANAGAGPAVFVASGSSVIIRDSIVTRNSTTQSGALFLDTGGLSLTIVGSTLTKNAAATSGAAIRADGEQLTIENSTISNNQTTGEFGFGPAISVAGSATTATVTNSTISGNVAAESSSSRSAIFSNGDLSLVNSTVVGNDGGGIRRNTGTLTMVNSIVANQLAGPDCETPVLSAGHNLDSDGSCDLTATGDQPNTDPMLGALQDNDGPTLTHALLPDSPAINAGANDGCPTTDQRGIARPQGPTCDIGAVEFDGLLARVELNGSAFEKAQTVIYRGIVNPGLDPPKVDVYLGALLPDFVTFVSFVEVVPGQIGAVLGPVPVPYQANASAVSLSVAFEYTFTGAELTGTYFTYAALVMAGTNPLLPENQLSLAIEPFEFHP